jgi:uncharacterized protein (TIGR02118 family)
MAPAERHDVKTWRSRPAEAKRSDMHTLMVLYPPPDDPEHFRKYYTERHLPLVEKLPGLQAMRYGVDIEAMEGKAPYFCVFQADFENERAMVDALQSEEGRRVASDVPNYASGGALLLHFEAGD